MPLHSGSLIQPDAYSHRQFDSWFRWCLVWPRFTTVLSPAVAVTRSRRLAKGWPIRGHVTNTFYVLASPTGLNWPKKIDRPTNLGGEDIIGDVPNPLAAIDVGVAHTLHFAKDGAHRRVSGLVSLLVDKHPPAKWAESILSVTVDDHGAANCKTVPRSEKSRSWLQGKRFISILHCNSRGLQRTSEVVNKTPLCKVTVTPCIPTTCHLFVLLGTVLL